MSTPEHERIQRGDRIPARLLNEHSDSLERSFDISAQGGARDWGAINVPQWQRPMFPAMIAGADSSSPVKYSWSRVQDPQTDPPSYRSCEPWPDVVTGGPLYGGMLPAYEQNQNSEVPIGAVVQMQYSENGECLWFFYPGTTLPPTTTPPGASPPGTNPGPQPTIFVGGMLLFGPLDVQGPVQITPTPQLPPPTLTEPITFPSNTPTTTYTIVTTGVLTTGIETTPSNPLTVPIPTSTPPSLSNPLNLTQTLVPGITAVNVYFLTPTPPGLVLQVPLPVGTLPPTLLIPITTTSNPAKPPPTTISPTNIITTPGVLTTGLVVTQVPPPPAPSVTPPTPGISTITVELIFIIDGGMTVTSTPTTINTAPGTITSTNPLNIAITIPTSIPPALVPGLTVGIYLTTPNTTTNPNGPVLCIPVPPGTRPGDTFTVQYTGTPVLPYLPSTPPAVNTTGTTSLDTIVGTVDIEPLTRPAMVTVTPITTGSTTFTYGVVGVDSAGNTTDKTTGTTSTGGDSGFDNLITWTPVAGAVIYRLYRIAGGATQGLIATVNGTSYEDTGTAGDGSTAPASNTTGKLLIGGVPVTPGAGGNTMAEGTGTTTDSFVTITNLDVTDANGIVAQIGVKNTGATNSLTVQVIFTDAFGGTNTTTPTSATPGGVVGVNSMSSSTRFPVTRVQVQVKSASPGNSTTFDGKMSYN